MVEKATGLRSREDVDRLLVGPGGPFEMETAAIDGVAVRVYKTAPPHLGAVFESGRSWGDREYLVYENERLTFARHQILVGKLASEFVQHYGVKKGDRIAIAMRNMPEWSIAFWAAVTIGAIAVPLNAWWTGAELSYAVTDSGARIVVLDTERYTRVLPFVRKHEIDALIVTRCSDIRLDARTFDSIVGEGSNTSGDNCPAVEIQPDDGATIFYTSGTTGRPKGALSSHRAITTFLSNIALSRARGLLREGASLQEFAEMRGRASTLLLTVPLFHVIGCYAHLIGAMANGAKIILMYKWDVEKALDLVEEEKVNSFTGVPTVVLQALAGAKGSGRDLSSLQAVSLSGAAAPPEMPYEIAQVVPQSMPGNAYGLTESSGVISAVWGRDYVDHPGSVGYALPSVDVKVVEHDSGQTISTGEIGEIWIRSAGVIKGYWNNPEASAATISDGWLKTGDLGYLDADNFLYVVDRAKDMIIRGGENVYSIEIENVLQSHPDVLEAAVFGMPHAQLGEEVAAVVSVRPGARTSEEQLTSYAYGNLARYKVPSRIQIRNEPLPRNAAGKLVKRELRSAFSNTLNET